MIAHSDRDNYFKSNDVVVLQIKTTLQHISYEMDQVHQAQVPNFWKKEFPALQAEKKASKPSRRWSTVCL